jgi:hypothetical protein
MARSRRRGRVADPAGPIRSKLKDPSAFRYIGKGNVAMVDLYDITVGPGDLRARTCCFPA